jgi:hypothetical protein
MVEHVTQNMVQREYVGECEWDRRFAGISDDCLTVPELHPRLVDSARKEAESLESAYRTMIENEQGAAENQHALMAQVLKETQKRHDETEKQCASATEGSWLTAIFMVVLTALAVASEAILNNVLPYAMGATGLFATALMVAPAFVLPQVLERLTHPLLVATSKFGRWAKGLFYWLTALLILSAVSLIGLIRGTIGEIRGGAEATSQQLQIINITLLVLGICVTVCAVIASYTAGVEFSRARRTLQLKLRLKVEGADLEAAREDEMSAANRLSAAKQRFDARIELARQYKEEFLATRMAMMEARLARIKISTPVTAMLSLAEKLTVFSALGLGWAGPSLQPPPVFRSRELEAETIA